MYSLPYFKEHDKQTLLTFIEQHPFAFVTGCTASGQPVATQIPMILEERDGEWFLQGHIMRHTDHHRAFIENPNALLVFTGPHCYVSASWYSNPQAGSTWNYMSVHVRGEIRFMTGEAFIDFMKKFTLRFEAGNTLSPTIYDNLPDTYRSKMIEHIIGFEVKVNTLENVFKLSQNRDEESYTNIIAKLQAQGGDSALIAAEMIKRKPALFSTSTEN